ncbi:MULTISPECIES: molybdate ABC transporter permease subunit [unclassified Guyparkeria]|uniref:molybdate ABC transporter permease subunit n=1 Tax=unclassified Guyparkeria TaxID=2626246 RepID=UPI0007334FA5|nr:MULTISPECIES: molybdate ABC transporter permease subunit [unclassified Guyparkeria]KTG16880.1 molybdenum ABC transporter permease [Guyparkeria sp. XI15]OAE85914.1 molybdenum ABC transporter permease [Guyparkeria sp. WRN-7]
MTLFGIPLDTHPIWLTLQVATLTTLMLAVIGIPLAWWLARMRSRWRVLLEALVSLPLVLPPTVLGFYLIIALGPAGPVTDLLGVFGFEGQLTFNLAGLVIGSVLFSLPFMVQPLMSAFQSLPEEVLDAARLMRAGTVDRFVNVVLPLSRQGLVVGAVLTFAHTVGEFGVVLMVGGNIEGQTRLVSIAIFDHVESFEYAQAHLLSAIMVLFSFVTLVSVYLINRRLSARLG